MAGEKEEEQGSCVWVPLAPGEHPVIDPLGLQFISGKFPGHDNAVIWEPHFGTTKNPDEKIL